MSQCGNKEGRHMAFNKKAVYLPGNEIYLYSLILNGVLINLPLKGKLHLNFQLTIMPHLGSNINRTHS
jgi:hypothetical protein